jgi:hypothetical protein
MSYAPHMELVTELMPLIRRDFATSLSLHPDAAEPLLDGEWLALNSSYQAVRGVGEQLVPTYPVFAERGRYDVQAIGKVPLLFAGMFEFDTDIVNTPHGLLLGDPVVVADVTAAGGTKKGFIKPAGVGAQHLVVGWVTRLPTSGKVRILHTGYTYYTTAA